MALPLNLNAAEPSPTLLLLVIIITISAVFKRFHRPSVVKTIPGPPSPSVLLGHEHALLSEIEVGVVETPWFEKYGQVFRTRGIFGIHVLHIADPKALQYIFHTSGYNFPKAYDIRKLTSRMFGLGLNSANGTAHQRQRRVMNPAFSTQQLRTFLSVFQSSALQLSKKWEDMAAPNSTLDVYTDLAATALDIIGKTGFDYEFNALSGEANALGKEMRSIFADSAFPDAVKQLYSVHWRYLPVGLSDLLETVGSRENTRFKRYQAMTRDIVKDLLAQKKRDGVDHSSKDILSVLARSNDSEVEKLRITEEEVWAQVAAFIFAGHDTTAVTLAWLFYALSLHPDQQARLRVEIANARSRLPDGKDFSAQDYDESMPFLNACLKEVLRYYPVFPALVREADRDDIIPLSEPIVTTNGQVLTSVPVRKGQRLWINIHRYNRLKSLWGDDAEHWNPERFMQIEKKDVSVGVYANLMSFSAGVQSCIAWKFSIIELQSVTVAVISKLELSPPDKEMDVVALNLGLMKPAIRGELSKGSQMPLKITRISTSLSEIDSSITSHD